MHDETEKTQDEMAAIQLAEMAMEAAQEEPEAEPQPEPEPAGPSLYDVLQQRNAELMAAREQEQEHQHEQDAPER